MEGIIVLKKPIGITSFDVIKKLRNILRERRIGHTGTLDPLATGVMIICLGRATRMASDIEASCKEYIAGFELGYRTDTQDLEGNIIARSDNWNIDKDTLSKTLKKYIGKIKQIPPMHSAIKKDGQTMYKLARQGIHIELEPRDIEINSIDIIDFDGHKGRLLCNVSKGTYIRALIDDIGKDLGCYATLVSLERTKVGIMDRDTAFSLEDIEAMMASKNYDFLYTVENFFHYKKLKIPIEKDVKLFKNGNTVVIQAENGIYKVYDNNNIFLGIGKLFNNRLKGYRYF